MDFPLCIPAYKLKDLDEALLCRCWLDTLFILVWVPTFCPKCEKDVYCLSVYVGGTGGRLGWDCRFLRGLFVPTKESFC